MNPLHRNDRPGAYPPSWYLASAPEGPRRPDLRGEVEADVAVVGAGFTGLSAALHLAQAGLRVVVLEAHRVGFGASGRNGGQVGSGFNRDPRWLAARLGDAPARALWDLAQEAKALTRDLVVAHAPEARYRPGVLSAVWTEAEAEAARRSADWLARHYGHETEPVDRAGIRALCPSPGYAGGVLDRDAGHLHPLRLCYGLAAAAEAAGAVIHEGTEVHAAETGLVRARRGRVRADHVILAGNGYLPNLSRPYAARVMPINSFIAATEPLGDLAREVLTEDIAVHDNKFVVNYFRLSEDGRLLFGGRESYGIGFPQDIDSALEARIARLFPALAGTKVTQSWGGTLGITMTRLPYLARPAPGILAAGGYSGHGVALALLCGRLMAEAAAGRAAGFELMERLPVPGFPGGSAFRTPLLTLAMSWFSLRDRLGI